MHERERAQASRAGEVAPEAEALADLVGGVEEFQARVPIGERSLERRMVEEHEQQHRERVGVTGDCTRELVFVIDAVELPVRLVAPGVDHMGPRFEHGIGDLVQRGHHLGGRAAHLQGVA